MAALIDQRGHFYALNYLERRFNWVYSGTFRLKTP